MWRRFLDRLLYWRYPAFVLDKNDEARELTWREYKEMVGDE